MKLIVTPEKVIIIESRPPARTRGLKHDVEYHEGGTREVASSREDAWIETAQSRKLPLHLTSRPPARTRGLKLFSPFESNAGLVASSREDAWIET